MKLLSRLTALVCCLALTTSSYSIPVFDVANVAQTTATALATAASVTNQVKEYLETAKRYVKYLEEAKAIAGGDYQLLAKVAGVPALGNAVRDITGLRNALQTLNGDLGNMTERFNYTTQMAQKYGMTLDQYQTNQSALIAKKVKTAKLEQDANVKAINQVKNTFSQVAEIQTKLQAAGYETDKRQFQIINQQMALLNTTNARLLEYMVKANDKAIQAETAAAGKEQAALKDAKIEGLKELESNKKMAEKIAYEYEKIVNDKAK